MPKTLSIVVLISGSGRNLQAIIDSRANNPLLDIKAVISNNPTAYGLKRAELAGIPHFSLPQQNYASRAEFETALMQLIDQFKADWLVLAGFMRLLSANFVAHYPQRILNIHPSLLPQYPGLNTHARALADKAFEHGASIHLVDAGLDSGPLLAQATLKVAEDDTEQSLQERVMALETELYPQVLQWLCEGRLQVEAKTILFDGKALGRALNPTQP